MSFPTLLPSGALHPDLVNNSSVKYVSGYAAGGAAQGAGAGKPGEKAQLDQARIDKLGKSLSDAYREGRLDMCDLSDHFSSAQAASCTARDGKTIVENRGMGFIVEQIVPGVITADDANIAAKQGAPTHGFFYRSTDFLLDAAKEYASLGENEVFRHRNINDVNFVRDALDFLTDGNYSQNDVNAVQEQMTEVVRELSQQLKNGESPDLSKLQSKLTIGGEDVSISQLMDMQKMGRELSESFNGITSGSLSGSNTEAFAKMGIAKSLGNYYGSDKGKIGQMFSAAVDRLYEKGVAQVEKAEAWGKTVSYAANTSSNKDAVKTELDIADLFSKLDTSSKSSLEESFSSMLSQARTLVQQYCDRYNMLTSHVGLAGATDGISKFFQAWMDKI